MSGDDWMDWAESAAKARGVKRDREAGTRRWADDCEYENSLLRRQIAQLTRAIEGAA